MSLLPPSQRQAQLIWLAATGLALAVLVGLVVALIWSLGYVLQLLSPVLWPLALAGVLAYLLDPVVDLFERQGLPRTRAIVAVFSLALVIIGALFGSVVPQLVNETRLLAARVPGYVARLQSKAQEWANRPPPLLRRLLEIEQRHTRTSTASVVTNQADLDISTNAAVGINSTNASPAITGGSIDKETLQTATGWLTQVLPRIGQWLFGQVGRVASWFGVLVGLALIPVYTFYFLLEKQGISSRWTDYLPVADSRFKNELVFVLNSVNNYLISFFRGQVLVAICDGVLYGIGFLIVGLPYALLIGVTAIVLTMIPFLGAIVTCVTALVIALIQFGDWLHPFLVLIVFGCVQGLEGLVISPRIMGGRVGLHPLTIIIAVMVGTTLLGGLLGGILSIPLTAALRVVMFRYIWKRPQSAQ
jgi:predicted PurR-regulated permease PerM